MNIDLKQDTLGTSCSGVSCFRPQYMVILVIYGSRSTERALKYGSSWPYSKAFLKCSVSVNNLRKEKVPWCMSEAFVAVAAVAGQVVFYFVQKALDDWWKSHFPPSNGNTDS